MMESTAIFFSVSYFALVLRALKARLHFSPYLLIAIALAGSLAGAVKVTTYATFLLAAASAILWDWWKERHAGHGVTSVLVLLFAAAIVPFLLTTAWTHYADSVKQTPATAWLTSKAQMSWNFGSFGQRLQLANYARFGPVIDSILGHRAIFALIFAGLLFVPRRRKHIAGCLALWASDILIFFNLHYVHSYYAYANGIFLLAALGFVIVGLHERSGAWRWVAACMLALCVCAFPVRYFREFYWQQRSYFSPAGAVAQVVTRVTQPDDVILVYGLDWSSELPYLAHRRAILRLGGAELRFALSHLPPRKLGAVVICGHTRNYLGRDDLLTSLSFNTNAFAAVSEVEVSACEIHLPSK